MKISLNWLKTFVDIDLDPETLGEKISMAGLEVDSVTPRKIDYPGVVVGRVVACEKHPDADKLSVCRVDTGEAEPLSIVCGAPNVAAGQTVPVATVGTVLPGDFKIRKAKIRGVASAGMICSQEELQLADKSAGIWVLADGLTVGQPLHEALKFETDYVFDIGVTPNRPDALSQLGVAREVAALLDKRIDIPRPQVPENGPPIADHVRVTVDCPDSCPRYAVRLIRNVKIGPSPEWMARRLEAVGMRSINNLVDITNYIMMETGQPLHAFDYDLIENAHIRVRESRSGEIFVTLDDKSHTLNEGTVMICDDERAVALGGIMGGQNTEVNDNTRNILLEGAYFSPDAIRRSLRHLRIGTEASQRFERGADPNGIPHALDRAAELFARLAGGEVCRGLLDVYRRPVLPVTVDVDVAGINRLLGTDLSLAEMTKLLAKIEMPVTAGKLQVPTYRPDITETADVAEEVGRLFGYDRIPLPVSMPMVYSDNHNEYDDFVDNLRDVLVGIGLQEVVTNSMIRSAEWEELTGEAVYPIRNPVSSDMDGMRNALLPSLLPVLRWNVNRQVSDLALFEVNKMYRHPGSIQKRPEEELRLAIALTGKRHGEHWTSRDQLYDFYDIKGIVEYLADKISLDKLQFIAYDNFAVCDPSVQVKIGKTDAGYLGRLREKVRTMYDIEAPVWVAELSVSVFFGEAKPEKQYREVPKFPWVERDLALVVSREEPVEALLKQVYQNGGKFLKTAFVFDVYSGKQIGKDQKSVAIRLIYQSPDKTLTDKDVSSATDKILRSLESSFGASLRA